MKSCRCKSAWVWPWAWAWLVAAGCLVNAAGPGLNPTAVTNLVAWCIVPFDTVKRGPEERAAMLERLGITQLAYDWRAEHIPTFDAEVAALQRHGIHLRAWWFPATLNSEADAILACVRRNRIHPELWVMSGEPAGADQTAKVNAAAESLRAVVRAAGELGCKVGLYNHGGWFGEPENQLAIRARFAELGHTNVGLVYNFHHGHDHLDRLPALFPRMVPHLLAVNLNGMVRDGERLGKKILPYGGGEYDLPILDLIRRSGYAGPVGILGHTEEDAELKLQKDLAGLHRVEARWAARESAAWPPPSPPRPRPTPPPAMALTGPERAGGVLDVRGTGGRVLAGRLEFRQAPLTIEAWVRLQSKAQYNILVASETKASPTHWELYTHAGSGFLALYLPGSAPTGVNSTVDVCDGRWHHVAAHLGASRVQLFLDGLPVADAAVQPSAGATGGGARIAVGRLVEGGLGCDGWLDDVRLSRGLRAPLVPPPSTLVADDTTLALWRFESAAEFSALPAPGSVPADGPIRARSAPVTMGEAGTPKVSGQEPGVQKEQDWIDNRWSQMDVGPAFASNLHLPDGSVIAKALTVQLPGPSKHCVAYDLATGALRAAWTGGFLRFDPARFGLMGGQKPAVPPWFLSRTKAGFPNATYHFLGYRIDGSRVLLEHSVDGVKVTEIVMASENEPALQWIRHLAIEPTSRVLRLNIAEVPGASPTAGRTGTLDWLTWKIGDAGFGMAVDGPKGILHRETEGTVWVEFPPTRSPQLLSLAFRAGPQAPQPASREMNREPGSILHPPTPAAGVRPTVLTTRGQRGADTDILAVDTLTMPYDNPSRALLFASGVDLTLDGTAYVCTMHGDVWRVTGIDSSLRELKWARYATGLFQPLGLKVRGGVVYVLGRDRITRLHDTDGDGVADHYENFHDGIQTSTGGHDYVTCLEQDAAGNFYYVDPLGLHRVSADGRDMGLMAAGFRNPNGMGVSPDGRVLTVAPQQGTRTPSSGIWETSPETPGLWGGYPEPRITPERPLGYDAPLCWIPHGVDNSSGSQVWVPSGKWGPLGGQMLHLLWGRCSMMLALRDVADGRRNGVVVPLPAKFLAGPNRGSFFGDDLYVVGSTGWQTSAVRDGSLQRVRWTGKRFLQPIAWEARRDGIDLTFAETLRRETATDPGSYGVKRWNYLYSAQYGSKDWSVTNPQREGRDEVAIASVTLSADGRTVSLKLGPLDSVMQFEVKYNLDAADGKSLKGSLWGTVNPAGQRR